MTGGRRVVVVGGGPAGLAAAYRLQQAGVNVVVLEKGEQPGGKIRTVTDRGFLLDVGATAIPSSYDRVLRLAHDVGLADRIQECGTVVGFAREGEIHNLDSAHLGRDAIRTKMLTTRSKLTLVKLAWDSVRLKKFLSYEDISGAGRFDTETAEAYARRRLNDEIFEYVVDTTLRGLLGTSGTVSSKIDFFFAISNIIGGGLYVFEGGSQTYTDRLASTLTVRTGAAVHEVRADSHSAHVEWTDADGLTHTEEADACVVATWGTAVPKIVPQLDPVCRDYLSGLRYTDSVNCHVALSVPPPDTPAFIVQVPRRVHPGLSGIILDHNKARGRAPAGKGLLSTYSTAEWSSELIDEDDDVVAKNVIDAVDQVLPGTGDAVEFVRVHRWRDVVVYSRPGTYAGLTEFNRHRPRGPIYLAGDYFSCSNLNSATAAGERAAREVLQR
jgi:protoporphyrinogen/coproporphyrinogen III oxidase